MVDSNIALSSSKDVDAVSSNPNAITASEARSNIEYLQTQAGSWLAVFFNIFGTVGTEGRGMIADVIKCWAGIAGEQVRLLLLLTSAASDTQ